MKILNVIENVDEKTGGGAAERARQISFHLKTLGHNVKLLTTDIHLGRSENTSLLNLNLIALPCINERFYIPWPSLTKINNLVKESEIIQLFSHWTVLNVIVYLLIRLNKKPYILTSVGALTIFGRSSSLKKIYNIIFGKRIIRNASKHILATMSELPVLQSYGVDKIKVAHLPNAINEEDYPPKIDDSFKEDLGIGNSPFILFVGRLNPIKGPDMLLKAFDLIKEEHPDVNLVFIGPDEGMLDELKTIARAKSIIEKVHFLGYLSGSKKVSIIRSSLFLCIPSHREAMSIVVLEAGICSKPALITNECGFDEVEKIEGGFVVKADIDSIADGLKKMLSDANNLNFMGLNLQKLVQKNYLWSQSSIEHQKLFNEILETQSSSNS